MPTSFDALCAFAEKRGGADINTVKMLCAALPETRLFEIEAASPKAALSAADAALLSEELHLPFDIIAVEDAESCVILVDLVPNQVGISAPRFVAFAAGAGSDVVMAAGITVMAAKLLSPDALDVTVDPSSVFSCLRTANGWDPIADNKTIASTPGWLDAVTSDIATHYLAALREIMIANVPANFVLESSPVRMRNEKHRLLRSHERPTYTLLRPNEIRRRMHLPESTGDGRIVAPHERRGHFRTLRDERFTRLPDGSPRRIWIPATWVGPAENVVGERRYRVILD